MFSCAEPCALKPLLSMLMFSDWLMNLLINPLVCAMQHCPLWNAIREKWSHDRMTCCHLEFQSQWQLVSKWSLVWYCLQLISVPKSSPWMKKVVLYTLVDLVIKTSATLCNINDFGRYQRMNLRDAVAWSKPTLIMCLIPSAIHVFLQRFHVEPCARIKAF